MANHEECNDDAESPSAGREEARRVAMLIYPGVAPLDVAGPLEVFGVCNFLRKRPIYEIVTVAPSAGPVSTMLGLSLLPTCAMADLPLPVDTLLISGGGAPEASTRSDIVAWLQAAAPRARRYGSICTGAFALGAAGLIQGRRVATHWAFASELARRNPDAKVEADPIFVRDGALYSSAGITAGIDLALALVEEDHGRELALAAARFLVVFLKRSGGQAQFSTHLQAQFSEASPIQRARTWCLENLDEEITVARLAGIAGMSERNFSRVFTEQTGQSPAQFVSLARAEAARRLLEESRLSMKMIAQRRGFRTTAAPRRNFAGQIGVPPAFYREKFNTMDGVGDDLRQK